MINLRYVLLSAFVIIALAAMAEQSDPIISSIDETYSQAKAATKKNKGMGNELVATRDYTVRGKGKTTETIHFFYNTVEGTYMLSEGEDPHFFYYPLFFISRDYNLGKRKYHEEYLFNPKSQRLLFALTQDYDDNGKRFDRRFYFNDGTLYDVIGPEATDFMKDVVFYYAQELQHAFDWLVQNPKE